MNKSQLISQIKNKKSFLCVGLDPDIKKIPSQFLNEPDPIFEFNAAVIDATYPYCVAYKPNFAFYEMYGSEGIQSLEKIIRYIKINYPDKFIIADAKRGDIGNTSEMYAKSVFEKLECDAITLSPYMGKDSIMPFLKYNNKWSIILAITSNDGASDFQMLDCIHQKPLFIHVIEKSKNWGNDNNTMYVIGATHQPHIIHQVRNIIPNHFLLIPGIGTQGGSLQDIAMHAMNNEVGIIVNVSRDIIYASHKSNISESISEKAKYYQIQMEKILISKKII